MAEVKLENVSKRFGKRVWAVRDFTLHVEDREFLVLTVPRGAEKPPPCG